MLFKRKNTQNNSRLQIKKVSTGNIETKSESESTQYIGYRSSFRDTWSWLSASMAWNFYEQASPVYNAIDIIAQEFAGLMPHIWNKADKKFVEGGDKKSPLESALQLFINPSTGVTGLEFRKQIATSFLATGNIFIYLTAVNENSEPKEINYINPIDIQINVGSDGYVESYQYNRMNKNIVFYKDGINNYRYLTKDKTKELWQIQKFNPRKSSTSGSEGYLGMSPLHPIYLEIDEYIESYIHNKSLLKNGQRLSGMFLSDKNLSDKQFNNLMLQIKTEIQGAQNNGEIIVLDGLDENNLKFVPLAEVAKDLDFKQLIDNTRQQIYRILKIPAPLVELNTQKYDNFNSALAVLYRMAVLPLAREIYTELNLFLDPRYKDSNNYEIWYDKSKVDALEAIELDASLKKIRSNRLTDNEGRRLLGYEDVEGGDIISKDQKITQTSSSIDLDKGIANLSTGNRLKHVMENQYNSSGDKVFSEVEIKQALEKNYGYSES